MTHNDANHGDANHGGESVRPGAAETGADTLNHMDPVLTALYIAKTHGPHAGEEALMRALICERQRHHTSARFWMGIYERLVD
jgi:hypothetical protein